MNFLSGGGNAATEGATNKQMKAGAISSCNNNEDAAAIAAMTQPATAGSSLKSTQGQGLVTCFPNGNQSLGFEEFIEVIKDSCSDTEYAENYLVFAFSMFDREKKGYINA